MFITYLLHIQGGFTPGFILHKVLSETTTIYSPYVHYMFKSGFTICKVLSETTNRLLYRALQLVCGKLEELFA